MYLFSFLVFPAAFVCHVLSLDSFSERKEILHSMLLVPVFSLLLSAIVCAVDAFFIFEDVYRGENFLFYALEKFFSMFVIPLLFYFLFFIFSKDSAAKKISAYLLFILPFYIIYMPFKIFSVHETQGIFDLFIKPVFILCLVLNFHLALSKIFLEICEKKKTAFCTGFISLIFSFVPFVLEGMNYYGTNIIITVTASLLYIAVSFANYKRELVKKVISETKRST